MFLEGDFLAGISVVDSEFRMCVVWTDVFVERICSCLSAFGDLVPSVKLGMLLRDFASSCKAL